VGGRAVVTASLCGSRAFSFFTKENFLSANWKGK
jgi:hypothetical protein